MIFEMDISQPFIEGGGGCQVGKRGVRLRDFKIL